jgi:hypothetical protein
MHCWRLTLSTPFASHTSQANVVESYMTCLTRSLRTWNDTTCAIQQVLPALVPLINQSRPNHTQSQSQSQSQPQSQSQSQADGSTPTVTTSTSSTVSNLTPSASINNGAMAIGVGDNIHQVLASSCPDLYAAHLAKPNAFEYGSCSDRILYVAWPTAFLKRCYSG